jgi:hypothetical protein
MHIPGLEAHRSVDLWGIRVSVVFYKCPILRQKVQGLQEMQATPLDTDANHLCDLCPRWESSSEASAAVNMVQWSILFPVNNPALFPVLTDIPRLRSLHGCLWFEVTWGLGRWSPGDDTQGLHFFSRHFCEFYALTEEDKRIYIAEYFSQHCVADPCCIDKNKKAQPTWQIQLVSLKQWLDGLLCYTRARVPHERASAEESADLAGI